MGERWADCGQRPLASPGLLRVLLTGGRGGYCGTIDHHVHRPQGVERVLQPLPRSQIRLHPLITSRCLRVCNPLTPSKREPI